MRNDYQKQNCRVSTEKHWCVEMLCGIVIVQSLNHEPLSPRPHFSLHPTQTTAQQKTVPRCLHWAPFCPFSTSPSVRCPHFHPGQYRNRRKENHNNPVVPGNTWKKDMLRQFLRTALITPPPTLPLPQRK